MCRFNLIFTSGVKVEQNWVQTVKLKVNKLRTNTDLLTFLLQDVVAVLDITKFLFWMKWDEMMMHWLSTITLYPSLKMALHLLGGLKANPGCSVCIYCRQLSGMSSPYEDTWFKFLAMLWFYIWLCPQTTTRFIHVAFSFLLCSADVTYEWCCSMMQSMF